MSDVPSPATDPSPTPGADVPSSTPPEIDPSATPEEAPPPTTIPDDGLGRPIDGSALGSGDADPE